MGSYPLPPQRRRLWLTYCIVFAKFHHFELYIVTYVQPTPSSEQFKQRYQWKQKGRLHFCRYFVSCFKEMPLAKIHFYVYSLDQPPFSGMFIRIYRRAIFVFCEVQHINKISWISSTYISIISYGHCCMQGKCINYIDDSFLGAMIFIYFLTVHFSQTKARQESSEMNSSICILI